jgi:hypothetical protein
MTWYPLYRRLGWSGWVLKISPPQGFDLQTIQLVASCYTDYALPAPIKTIVTPLPTAKKIV